MQKIVFLIWKQNSYRTWQRKAGCIYNSTQKHTVGQINCSTDLERQGSLAGFPWLMQCKDLTANSRFRAPCKPTGKRKKLQQGVHYDCLPDKELQGHRKRFFFCGLQGKEAINTFFRASRAQQRGTKFLQTILNLICIYSKVPLQKRREERSSKKRQKQKQKPPKVVERGIWTLQHMLLFSLHRSLRTLCYITIQAALPALKTLPVGQDPITCLSFRHEVVLAKHCWCWYTTVQRTKTYIMPLNINKSRDMEIRGWGLWCHPPPAETRCQRNETGGFQGYKLTGPPGQPLLQGTIIESYFTPPFPTSSVEQQSMRRNNFAIAFLCFQNRDFGARCHSLQFFWMTKWKSSYTIVPSSLPAHSSRLRAAWKKRVCQHCWTKFQQWLKAAHN